MNGSCVPEIKLKCNYEIPLRLLFVDWRVSEILTPTLRPVPTKDIRILYYKNKDELLN